MLHLIESEIEPTNDNSLEFNILAAFGISFHGSPFDRKETIKVKANKVLIRNIKEAMISDIEE